MIYERRATDTVVNRGVDIAPTSKGAIKVKVKTAEKTAECVRPVVEATSAEEQGNYTTVIIALYFYNACIMP